MGDFLPCPFCGSINIGQFESHRVECYDCHAEGPPVGWDKGSAEDKRRAWNRRKLAPSQEEFTAVEMIAWLKHWGERTQSWRNGKLITDAIADVVRRSGEA